jgi:hypothetical protein
LPAALTAARFAHLHDREHRRHEEEGHPKEHVDGTEQEVSPEGHHGAQDGGEESDQHTDHGGEHHWIV